MSSSLPLWVRIGLLVAAVGLLGVLGLAVIAPYTNGEGDACNPVYKGGSTPRGTEVVMEGAHDACDLKRSDRLLISTVALSGAAGLILAALLLRPRSSP